MKPTNRKINLFGTAAVLWTVVSLGTARADYSSMILSNNPVGYWRFAETAASPPLNKITNASTLGGAADGFVVDGAAKGEPGVVGNSIRFTNPQAATNAGFLGSKIDVPYNAALNPNPPFSIEFWAKPNTFSGDPDGYCPLSNMDPNFSAASRAGWVFYVSSNGTWEFFLGNRAGYGTQLVATNGNASLGVWQHIVATWDGAVAKLYANGALIGSTNAAMSDWLNNSQSFLRFGGTPLTGDGVEAPWISITLQTIMGQTYYSYLGNNGNRGFDGWLDEVAIYPKLLSPAAIAAHYAAVSTNNAGYGAQILADQPAAYWPLNDPAVTAPAPGSFPVAANSGVLGSAANGTNFWGASTAQPGPGYAGFGAGAKSVFYDGDNGYFQVDNAAGLHFSGPITLAAWVKPTEKDFFRDIIEHGFDDNEAETFLRISRGGGSDGSGDGNYYEVGVAGGANSYYDSVLVPIPPGDIGNWVFLAGTFDGTNWNLFRNGQLAGSIVADTTAGDNGALDVTNAWTIGSRGVDTNFIGQGEFFGGWIAEPAIFNTALAPSEIAALYNAAQAPPVFTAALQNPGTVFTGGSVSFSIWAEGSPTLGYLWTSNGVSTGVTATNYAINNLRAGTYTIAVIVTNAYGTNTDSVTFTAVAGLPVIATAPLPATRFVGFPFDFSVVAIGSPPLTYIWQLDGTVVQAGAASNYSGIAGLTNAGRYSVIVSNAIGISTPSAPVALTVNPIPAGYAAAVIASGPIAYWRLGEAPGSTVAHDGVGGNDGIYHNVTLEKPGYSSSDPDTAAGFSGTNSYVGDISGTAINFTGHTNFSLEAWVKAPAGQSNQATIIAKGIGATGTIETEQFALDVNAGVYRFFVTGSGDVFAANATEGPNGAWQHLVGVYDDLNTLGGGAVMSIYVNGVVEDTEPTIPAGLNDTVTPVSIGSKRTGNSPPYDGTFDGTVDEVAVFSTALSSNTILTHYSTGAYGTTTAPFVTRQPSPATNYAGLAALFSVGAAGTLPLSYQWRQNNTNIAGANGSTLLISPLTSGNAGNYSVLVTNSVSNIVSISVPLVVLPPPTNPPSIPDLVLHLTFETNLTDVTGRGNDGTGQFWSGTTTNTVAPSVNMSDNPAFYYVPDGALGRALHYSTEAVNLGGTTSIGTNDYYVSLGVRPDLQFGSNVSFTVAYWIRLPQGYTGGDLPFFTDAANSLGGTGFDFAPAYGYGTANSNPMPAPQNYGGWAVSTFSGSGGVIFYGDLGSINDGSWHHLVHVIDRGAGTIVTYLDGAVANAALQPGGTTLAAAGDIDSGLPATIGQDPTGQYGETGSADIDDLGVWRRALTALEAGSIYIAAVSNQLSYASPPLPVLITITTTSKGQLTITWPSGTLQSAATAQGPYTNVTGAVSPYPVTPGATGQKYYRVKL